MSNDASLNLIQKAAERLAGAQGLSLIERAAKRASEDAARAAAAEPAAGLMFCKSLPMLCGKPSRKSAQPLYNVGAEPPFKAVRPPLNVKPPRGPFAKRGYRARCRP